MGPAIQHNLYIYISIPTFFPSIQYIYIISHLQQLPWVLFTLNNHHLVSPPFQGGFWPYLGRTCIILFPKTPINVLFCLKISQWSQLYRWRPLAIKILKKSFSSKTGQGRRLYFFLCTLCFREKLSVNRFSSHFLLSKTSSQKNMASRDGHTWRYLKSLAV